MAPRQASQKRQVKARAKRTHRADTADSEGGQSVDSAAEMTADLLSKLNNAATAKRSTIDGGQKIQAHHKACVKKAEARLRDLTQSNRNAILSYRKSQFEKLSVLGKRKLEIENEIVRHVLQLEKEYKAANGAVKAMLAEKIKTLR